MRKVLALISLTLVAACVPSVAPPTRAPQPAPAPAPVPAPAPAPTLSGDWRDWPVTPGDWVYRQDARGSVAVFGAGAAFTIRCTPAQRQIVLSRAGTASGNPPMTIVTTSMTRALTSRPSGGTPPAMMSQLGAQDSLLDAMGYSRGRFIVEQAGLPTLVIPAWPEIERVIEDCRR